MWEGLIGRVQVEYLVWNALKHGEEIRATGGQQFDCPIDFLNRRGVAVVLEQDLISRQSLHDLDLLVSDVRNDQMM
jgi:hypothetical protein